jgi:hypothetical protein
MFAPADHYTGWSEVPSISADPFKRDSVQVKEGRNSEPKRSPAF